MKVKAMPKEFAKIPSQRIAVLIGKKGETKKDLEKQTKTKINIDSDSGEVVIQGKDAFQVHLTSNTVKAISRGFSPEHAFLLLQENYYFDLIDLKDELGKSEKEINLKKSRVIGSQGKTRKIIEKETGCFVSVYGKTIALIGKAEEINFAKQAIEMLLKGKTHKTVYKFLFKKKAKEFIPEFKL